MDGVPCIYHVWMYYYLVLVLTYFLVLSKSLVFKGPELGFGESLKKPERGPPREWVGRTYVPRTESPLCRYVLQCMGVS
ncbi:hypothetical protein BDV26DRAFT_275703, partial [Aspergillus bertholletiae]